MRRGASAALASKLGVPVRWTESRIEAAHSTIQGRGQIQDIELAADENGRITAVRVRLIADMGAYLQLVTPGIPLLGAFLYHGVYDIPAYSFRCTSVFTNLTPTDAYRGAGRPEATYAIERAIDTLGRDLGVGPVEIRRRIGFVTEDKELYPYMTVEQAVRFTRPFFPRWRDDLAQRYLRSFELPAKQKIPKLSKGMRSKLMLLLAICRGAELLILDEPMEGLDPAVAEDVLSVLTGLAAEEGTTIFFSSHQIADVEQIADHVCIIDRGRAVVAGALDDLKSHYQRLHVVFAEVPPHSVRWVDGVERVRHDGRMLSIFASRNVDAVVDQVRSLPGASVERFPVTLKEIFLETVGAEN